MSIVKVFVIISTFVGGISVAIASAVSGYHSPTITGDVPVTLAITVSGVSVAFMAAWKGQGLIKDITHAMDDSRRRIEMLEKQVEAILSEVRRK